MPARKPQIAYAPVHREGYIYLYCVGEKAEAVKRDFAYIYGNWENAEAAGWRIARVRIEIDEENSGD